MLNRRRIVILAVAVTLLIGGVAPVGAQDGGYEHPEAEQVDNDKVDDDVWNEVGFRYSASVTVHHVEVQGDYAIIAMSSREGGEGVTFTDSTRQTTGENERQTAELEAGQQVYKVPLENPSLKAVSIDTENRLWTWVGEQDSDDLPLNLTPALLAPIAVLLGLLVGVTTIIGLDLFAKWNGGSTGWVR